MVRSALFAFIGLFTASLAGLLLAADTLYVPDQVITEGETAFTAQFKPVSFVMNAQNPTPFRVPPAKLLVIQYINARLVCPGQSKEPTTAVTLSMPANLPGGPERMLLQLSAAAQTASDGTRFFSLSTPLTQYVFPGEELGVVSPPGCRGSVSWAGRLLIYEGT